MSLEDVYQLLINESEEDYTNNSYLRSEQHISNLLKLLENYINKLTMLSEDEIEYFSGDDAPYLDILEEDAKPCAYQLFYSNELFQNAR